MTWSTCRHMGTDKIYYTRRKDSRRVEMYDPRTGEVFEMSKNDVMRDYRLRDEQFATLDDVKKHQTAAFISQTVDEFDEYLAQLSAMKQRRAA